MLYVSKMSKPVCCELVGDSFPKSKAENLKGVYLEYSAVESQMLSDKYIIPEFVRRNSISALP